MSANIYKREPSVEFSPELYSAFFNRSGWLWYPVGNDNDVGQYVEVPPATMGLRRTWDSPGGKVARNATIIVTVDNRFVFFVNGRAIGKPPSLQNIWFFAQKYHVALDGMNNIFAFAAINDPNPSTGWNTPAGLRAAIEVQYEDNSTDIFVSDSTRWKITNITSTVPSEWTFQNREIDDSGWPDASVYRYGTLWDGVAVEPPYRPYGLTLNGSSWIWHNNTDTPAAIFRRHLPISSRDITHFNFFVTADSYFDLYFNGKYVTSSTQIYNSWRFVERFTFLIEPNTDPLIAIVVTRNHTSSPSSTGMAGLIAVIDSYYTDGTWDTTRTEGDSGNWRVEGITFGPSALSPATNDVNWPKAVAIGEYGMKPWGNDLLPVDVYPAGLLGILPATQILGDGTKPTNLATRRTDLRDPYLNYWVGVLIFSYLVLTL